MLKSARSGKSAPKRPIKVPTSTEAVARVMVSQASKSEGEIPKGHYVADLQRTTARTGN